MKPKWKPHDDPACRCDRCKPQWAVDETSGIAIPQGRSEWQAFCAANGLPQPSMTYSCEAHGDAPVGVSVRYQQGVTGWNRTHVSLKDKS